MWKQTVSVILVLVRESTDLLWIQDAKTSVVELWCLQFCSPAELAVEQKSFPGYLRPRDYQVTSIEGIGVNPGNNQLVQFLTHFVGVHDICKLNIAAVLMNWPWRKKSNWPKFDRRKKQEAQNLWVIPQLHLQSSWQLLYCMGKFLYNLRV